MPKGTKVHKEYTKCRRKGKSKKTCAIRAQKKTGQALKTGKPIKKKGKK